MEEKIGIWIDKKEAYIIRIIGNNSNVSRIESSIESFHPKGGYGGKVPYGPSDAVNEKAYLAKEKKYKKEFFESIVEATGRARYLFIFGPAQMKIELKKFLESQHGFSPEIMLCETADSMTKNQMVAEVRGAFLHVFLCKRRLFGLPRIRLNQR